MIKVYALRGLLSNKIIFIWDNVVILSATYWDQVLLEMQLKGQSKPGAKHNKSPIEK
jgi:hypothetical protein